MPQKNEDANKAKYTDSLYYETEQLFKKAGLIISGEEFGVLDFIYENNDVVCQRDLALKMLINRANMGKIINKLQKKGFIEIKLSTKGNRPVKLAVMTNSGKETYLDAIQKIKNKAKIITDKITIEESKNTIKTLNKMRDLMKKMIDNFI